MNGLSDTARANKLATAKARFNAGQGGGTRDAALNQFDADAAEDLASTAKPFETESEGRARRSADTDACLAAGGFQSHKTTPIAV
jgi:hypothetical protein